MNSKTLLTFVFCIAYIFAQAQLTNTPYVIWNDPSLGSQSVNIRNTSSISGSIITTAIVGQELVAHAYAPSGGYNWYTVDLPGTSTSGAITGYCAGWYLSGTYYMMPDCSAKFIYNVATNPINIRTGAGTSNANITIGGANAEIFNGQYYAYTGSQAYDGSGNLWYQIYLPSTCSQTTGWVAAVYGGVTWINLENAVTVTLPAPTVSTPTNVTSNSMTVSWSTVPAATSYQVSYNGSVVNTSSTSSTLNGLTSGTNYSIQVVALYDNCTSPNSNSVNATTTSSCIPPVTPTNATATQTTITSGQSTTLEVVGGALNSMVPPIVRAGNRVI